MTRDLVLVHGRAQHARDPDELKAEWLDALCRGLAECGRTLPVPDSAVRFPFYGSVLRDLVDRPGEVPPEILIRGDVDVDDLDPHRTSFVREAVRDIAAEAGAGAHEAVLDEDDVIARGGVYSAPVRVVLAALDRRVSGTSDTAVRLLDDVYSYLKIPYVRQPIDDGVRPALDTHLDEARPWSSPTRSAR